MSKKLMLAFGFSLVCMGLVGCNTAQTLNQGYVQDENALASISEGASRDQVLLALGSPSTVTQTDAQTETFYYISQQKKRSFEFQQARIVDRRVLAIYFDEKQTVARKANFGLQDGKVFDFISRTTPTGGNDLSFIGQVLGAVGGITSRGR